MDDMTQPTVAERVNALTAERDAAAERCRVLTLQLESGKRDLASIKARHRQLCRELARLSPPPEKTEDAGTTPAVAGSQP